jgi:hypothetical protein
VTAYEDQLLYEHAGVSADATIADTNKRELDDIMGDTAGDVRLGDIVAAKTETRAEAEIDAVNGLRRHGGRRPQPEDFADILTPEGNSGDTVGSEIDKDDVFMFGEDGSTGGTIL